MKTTLVLLYTYFAIFFSLSCKTKATEQSKEPIQPDINATIYTFMSQDSLCQFEYQNTTDGITLKDLVNDTTYFMVQSPSGSGAKFSDEKGHTFWNHGDEFLWLLQDSIVCKGFLIN